MSATLDGARVAKLLGEAPVIASEGRAFAVETRYLGPRRTRRWSGRWRTRSPWRCAPDPGSVLAFLPGGKFAAPRIFSPSASTTQASSIVPLFGALDAAVQDRAIAPVR